MSTRLLQVTGLRKDFPGLRALDDVSFELRSGEVLAIVGQNGSGKSTLVKVLAGVYRAEAGQVALGEGGDSAVPEMHFIHQTRALIPELSTVENLSLGSSRSRLRLARRRERRHAEQMIGSFGLSFDVTRPIRELSPAERTVVAVVRALDGWSSPENILVLDEPTAELHGEEVGKLFHVVRQVAAAGAGVIFISHRLDEVIDLSDRVLALRDGRVVGDVPSHECDHDRLIQLIVGRSIGSIERTALAGERELVLAAEGLGGDTVARADLRLHAGEIVGVSGLLGSGRESLAGLLFGARRRERGEVTVLGSPLAAGDPAAAVAAQLAYVPPDRHADGAVMEMSVRENLTLPGLGPLRRALGRLDRRAELGEVRQWIDSVGLRPPEPGRRLELFSGGNQQKVVIAKWLRLRPRALLLDEPTQGVDVGAKLSIYELIENAAREGAAVLVTSADAKELVEVCDRVLVMRDGEIVAELAGGALEEERLLREELGLDAQQAVHVFDEAEEEEIRA
ncbi:MAG TPA: sugar ABC transporter ATP-binding protein [Solirubrobacterales bacterium]|nr:sugar ABC transporter ATP-binding protein [Solirubrobacterales bacterium]